MKRTREERDNLDRKIYLLIIRMGVLFVSIKFDSFQEEETNKQKRKFIKEYIFEQQS